MNDSVSNTNNAEWKCPNCGCEQIQSYELVSTRQTYINNSVEIGASGVSHPRLGVGVAHGVNRSKLAKSIPPCPEKLGWIYYLLFAILWGVCTLFLALLPSTIVFQVLLHIVGHENDLLTTIWVVLFFVAFLGGGYGLGRIIYGIITNHNEEAVKKKDIWKHSYICMRCGSRFVIK